MSKTVRISEIMIDRLEEYRNMRIERSKLMLSCCASYQSDIERLENLSFSDLVEDAILSAYVTAKIDVDNLSKLSNH